MSAVADGIDFLIDLVSSKSSSVKGAAGVDYGGLKGASGMTCMAFTFLWLMVYHKVSQKDFSAMITCAALIQCASFLLLSMRVRAHKSVAGISSKTMQMFVLYMSVRLCSTTLKRGYIPVDRSGHYFYQLMDFCTLVLAAHVVYCCHKTYSHTYQEEHDTFPIFHCVLPCVVLASFVHGDFNRNLFFDIIWFSSLNLETVTMLPQLWMMSKIGGKVNGVSKSFVIGQIVCKVICVTFWIWAYPELVDRKGSNLAGKHIFGAYLVQLLLSADFLFYYVKGMLEGTDAVVLPQADGIEM
jgi:ER lumen protein retaining receptor